MNSRPLLNWPLLPVPDAHGRLGWPTLERSIRDAIRIILSTRPGEQLMRPSFGGGLENMLHEPNTLATRRAMRELVQTALERHERRIVLDAVEVHEVQGEPSQVRVEVAYRVARTGAPVQLAVNVALQG